MNIDLSTIGEFVVHCTPTSIMVCNSADNMIHAKLYNGTEWWNEYDSNGKQFHYKNSNGSETWINEYDEDVSEDEYYSNLS